MATTAVCIRFRPKNKNETVSGLVEHSDKSFSIKGEKGSLDQFTFDHVFYEPASQEDVYNVVARPILSDVMQAVNCTLFCYGQTGAGKTFTMEGPNISLSQDPKAEGILPRVAHGLFSCIATAGTSVEFLLKMSIVEIYSERIRDLLDPGKDNLQVAESVTRGIHVSNVTEVYIQSEKCMREFIELGLGNRATGTTEMNAASSRSHCLFIIEVQQTDTESQNVSRGKLYLVDLAGSEKVEKTKASGQLLNEAKHINKSLSALGNVINALTSDKPGHIPYRDSKLTRILQESLGGNSRTALICCCSPASEQYSETLSTLRFGMRAKQIKNRPRANIERSRIELEHLLHKAEAECALLREEVQALTGGSCPSVSPSPREGASQVDHLLQSCIQCIVDNMKVPGAEACTPEQVRTPGTLLAVIKKHCTTPLVDNSTKSWALQRKIQFVETALDEIAADFNKLLLLHDVWKTELEASKLLTQRNASSTTNSRPRIACPVRGGKST